MENHGQDANMNSAPQTTANNPQTTAKNPPQQNAAIDASLAPDHIDVQMLNNEDDRTLTARTSSEVQNQAQTVADQAPPEDNV